MTAHLLIWQLASAITVSHVHYPSIALRARSPRASAVAATTTPVFLTREDGKNDKLQKLLAASGVHTEELPCIAFERLPGYDALCEVLASEESDWIVITSPEAASVFVEAWRESGSPSLARLATVGAGTAQALAAVELQVDFVPSKATGKTLADELPLPDDNSTTAGIVLYPASALAARTVEDGLTERGFRTLRIDTYTTVPAQWSERDVERAQAAEVVTFASPSAVRAWVERVGTQATAVCIGETSAAECRRIGFASERVLCPDKPGIGSWADEVIAFVNR